MKAAWTPRAPAATSDDNPLISAAWCPAVSGRATPPADRRHHARGRERSQAQPGGPLERAGVAVVQAGGQRHGAPGLEADLVAELDRRRTSSDGTPGAHVDQELATGLGLTG